MGDQAVLKALVLAGCGSRRAMTEAIDAKRVTVNNITVSSYTQHFDNSSECLRLDGKTINKAPPTVYLLINKPIGILCSTKDTHGRRTVLDLLPHKLRYPSLHIVGRLDMDSCGLILVTNDGALTNILTHPRFEIEKTYTVELDRELSHTDQKHFEKGILLSDGLTSTARIEKHTFQEKTYLVTLREGRKRQIRRMFAVLGYSVSKLQRIREAHLDLGDLPCGDYRLLTKEEVSLLKTSVLPRVTHYTMA